MKELLSLSSFPIKEFKIYAENWKVLWQKKGYLELKDILEFTKFYHQWLTCLQKNYWEGPLQDGNPWITFSGIDFLDSNLTKEDKVFEYGIGGSTIFLAKRVKKVVSVEHDPEWHTAVMKRLEEEKLSNVISHSIKFNCQVQEELVEPKNYNNYHSSHGLDFQEYVNCIDNYPDNYFDLVVIDGRARPSCIKKALPKVKSQKYLLLDNSDRSHYQLAIKDLLGKWNRFTFEGPTPYLQWFTQTSIWQKPSQKMAPERSVAK